MADAEDDGTITPVVEVSGRVESFEDLARRIAAGEQVVPPRLLTGYDRRRHVRSTLREDHATRIVEEASGTGEKFDELAGSLFRFFRGTALLFYRDMVGEDAHMPTVLALGDVHPENFGVMPNAEGVPIFSVNDFDEAMYAPFTWDPKRGAAGFWLAAGEEGGLDEDERAEVVRGFVRGYLTAMEKYASGAGSRTSASVTGRALRRWALLGTTYSSRGRRRTRPTTSSSSSSGHGARPSGAWRLPPTSTPAMRPTASSTVRESSSPRATSSTAPSRSTAPAS